MGGRGEQELLHGLDAEETDDEDDANDKAKQGEDIEDAAKAFPAFFLRVVEDGEDFVAHAGSLMGTVLRLGLIVLGGGMGVNAREVSEPADLRPA